MPKVIFKPSGEEIDVSENSKILAAAIRGKVDIRYGCAACRCGTCGVSIEVDGKIRPMEKDEKELLIRMGLPTDGHVRLACRARIEEGTVTVNLDFQETYSPDQVDEEIEDELAE